MTEAPGILTARLPARSMGLKLLMVCALALLMSIVALSVWAILIDRTNRAQSVSDEISSLIGGPQSFAGPMLAIPYTLPPGAPVQGQPAPQPTNGVYVVFPEKGDAHARTKTELRHRGIFSAPVWTADVDLTSSFNLAEAGTQAPKGAVLDWTRAEFIVGASDARGAQSDVVLNVGGKQLAMTPAHLLTGAGLKDTEVRRSGLFGGRPSEPGGLKFFGASAVGIATPGASFDAAAHLKFAGAKRLAVLAFARTTTFEAEGDWPDPSYDGSFLPIRKTGGDAQTAAASGKASNGGFTAAWSVPFIARGVAAEGDSDLISALGATELGVSFVEVANPYQSVSRSLKYAPMFIGLVFLAYFLFETTQHRRVHPAQYVLIGLAQIIFYMLLLSIAERIGFDAGFLVAATATVALISAYASWVFESRKQGLIALACFTTLYGLIYVLMRLEDLALLVGAVASFAAIAAVMYFTRRIDWYGQSQPAAKPA